MRDLNISTNQSPICPMVIDIRATEATLYKLAKVIESASELDHGDCVSAQVGNAQINVTQGEEGEK